MAITTANMVKMPSNSAASLPRRGTCAPRQPNVTECIYRKGMYGADPLIAARRAWDNGKLLHYGLALEALGQPVRAELVEAVTTLEQSWDAYVGAHPVPSRKAILERLNALSPTEAWRSVGKEASRFFDQCRAKDLHSLYSAVLVADFLHTRRGRFENQTLLSSFFEESCWSCATITPIALHLLRRAGKQKLKVMPMTWHVTAAFVIGGRELYFDDAKKIYPPGYYDNTLHTKVIREPWLVISATHLALGNALAAQDKLDEAITEYRVARRLEPHTIDSYCNLGNALAAQGKLDEAIAEYKAALRLEPHVGEVHYNLGNALRDQGKIEEAIAAYRAALRHAPRLAIAHNALGGIFLEQGCLDEAIREYEAALYVDPHYAVAQYNLGVVFYEQVCLEEAGSAFRAALNLDPQFAAAHFNLGKVLSSLGRTREAIAEFEAARQLDPQLF